MRGTLRPALFAAALLAALVPTLSAQSMGPDVIVGDLHNLSSYGSVGSIAAFAVGTTSCNIGTQNLSWIANTNQHPVIGYSMYRMKDGRFDMIGLSWLKHGFTALTGSVCNTCSGIGGSVLGVGCSDPYGSSLNGSQSSLGARSEVNAATGYFPYPQVLQPAYPSTTGRRLQVHHADLDPALNAGALYFVEGHYVTPDDAAAGNASNNASYRQVTVSPNGSSYSIAFAGSTQREKPAIMAWQDNDPSVTIIPVDVPNDGRILVGFKISSLGGGMYRHVYAVHNLNSDRSVGSLDVALPMGASATNLGFHDVDYHSNEIWDGTDWPGVVASNGVSWATTQTYAQNANANACRWGTTYTFSFDADAMAGDVTLGLFKPGTPTSMLVAPAWQTNQPMAHLDLNGNTNNAFSGPISTDVPSGAFATLNAQSTEAGAPWDLFVVPGAATPQWYISTNDQIVNVDLSDPGLVLLNGFFGAPFPPGGIALPFQGPNVLADLAAQMAVITPMHPDGYALSAANEVHFFPAPVVEVSAEGGNSYINNAVADGYWQVQHYGNSPASITQVILSFQGTSISSRYFDTEQTAMGGLFSAGTTYRNGSDAACGLDTSVSSPFAGSGWVGSDIVTTGDFRTVTFDFTGGLFHGQTFAFDADTDGGPTSQSGDSQAGMSVEVHMSDGTVYSGNLVVDPGVASRAHIEFF